MGSLDDWLRSLKGQKGDKGDGLVILGRYESERDLRLAHPVGEAGDYYLVGDEEDYVVYYWDPMAQDWMWFRIRGAQGPRGDAGDDFCRGYADSIDELKNTVTDPEDGEVWIVGPDVPLHVWIYNEDAGVWMDGGELGVSDVLDITPDEVSALWAGPVEDGFAVPLPHEALSGRDAEQQHPIEAITGLDETTENELIRMWQEG